LEEKLVDNAVVNGKYFKTQLEQLQAKHKIVKEVRGLGLMLGMELRFDVLNVILKALGQGVLVLDAGRTVVRMLPSLVIEKEQIDKAITVLDSVLGGEENERASSSTVPN
jgi:acetylornithine/LysW-gamma-L-lysine aminotransferase